MMMTRMATSATSAATSRTKRIRHGFEKNWNQYGEPLRRMFPGYNSRHMWVSFREKRYKQRHSEI